MELKVFCPRHWLSKVPLLEEDLVVYPAQDLAVDPAQAPGTRHLLCICSKWTTQQPKTPCQCQKLLFLVWFRLSEILGCITDSDKGHTEGGASCRRDQRTVCFSQEYMFSDQSKAGKTRKEQVLTIYYQEVYRQNQAEYIIMTKISSMRANS